MARASKGQVAELFAIGTSEHRITFHWQANASGEVLYFVNRPISGRVWRLVTNPTGSPTADYDVQLVRDADGADVLLGMGANRSATVVQTEHLATDTQQVEITSGLHRLVISGAGNATSGRIEVTLLP